MNPARLVFPGLRWGERGISEVWAEVSRALDLGVGGFVVFGGSVEAMRGLAARARDYAARPVLFAADLERGTAQQFEGATPLPPPAALGYSGGDSVAQAARITALEAREAGVGWVLAPVADIDVEASNPIVGTRSFGGDAKRVAGFVREWVTAAQAEGVHACAKHFPGHGRTSVDSHAELPVVNAQAADLEDDLLPFRAAIAAGVRTIMLAHVCYPALDPSGAPASLSKTIIDFLRDELGFKGAVVTDALMMGAIAASGRSEAEAVVEAVRAGCDALLYPNSVDDTCAALVRGLDSGDLDEARVAQAVERVEAAAEAIAQPSDAPRAPVRESALRLAVSSLRMVTGSVPRLKPGDTVCIHVVDDDVAPPARAAAPGSTPPERGIFGQGLEARGIRVLAGDALDGPRELIAVFSEVRAWKGRAGLAPESLRAVADLLGRRPDAPLILFAHPRLAAQLPGAANVACAWCGDPLMQDAAAAYLVDGGSV